MSLKIEQTRIDNLNSNIYKINVPINAFVEPAKIVQNPLGNCQIQSILHFDTLWKHFSEKDEAFKYFIDVMKLFDDYASKNTSVPLKTLLLIDTYEEMGDEFLYFIDSSNVLSATTYLSTYTSEHNKTGNKMKLMLVNIKNILKDYDKKCKTSTVTGQTGSILEEKVRDERLPLRRRVISKTLKRS